MKNKFKLTSLILSAITITLFSFSNSFATGTDSGYFKPLSIADDSGNFVSVASDYINNNYSFYLYNQLTRGWEKKAVFSEANVYVAVFAANHFIITATNHRGLPVIITSENGSSWKEKKALLNPFATAYDESLKDIPFTDIGPDDFMAFVGVASDDSMTFVNIGSDEVASQISIFRLKADAKHSDFVAIGSDSFITNGSDFCD